MVDLTPLKSKNIQKCGHCSETMDLHVQFPNGTWVYSNVPEDVVQAFRNAKSPTGYLRQNIVGKYTAKKL